MSMQSFAPSTCHGFGNRHWKEVTNMPLIVHPAVNIANIIDVYSKSNPLNSFRMIKLIEILVQPMFAMKRILDT